MGMYTEFNFKATLKKNIPENVLTLLKALVDTDFYSEYLKPGYRYLVNNNYMGTTDYDYIIDTGVKHDFLNCPRAFQLFHITPGTGYKASKLTQNQQGMYILEINSDFKNYDNEIELFLDWIKDYVNHGRRIKTYLGDSKYEEDTYRIYYHSIYNSFLNETELKETYG